MIVQGAKVVLREKRLSDAFQDYRWRTDSELARLDASAPLGMSFPDYRAFYQEDMSLPDPTRQRFAIEDLEGKHIGNCTYYDIDVKQRECQVGIMIGDKSYWNQGFGSDAMITLVGYIFHTTSFDRVYLETLGWNERAQRSFQKVGFVPCEKVHRPPYTFLVMEVCRHSWQPGAKAAMPEETESVSRAMGRGAQA